MEISVSNPAKIEEDVYLSQVRNSGDSIYFQTQKTGLKFNDDKSKCKIFLDNEKIKMLETISREVINKTSENSECWFGKKVSEEDCRNMYNSCTDQDYLYCMLDSDTYFYNRNGALTLDELPQEIHGLGLISCKGVVFTKTRFYINWEIEQFKIKIDKPKTIFTDYIIIDKEEDNVPIERSDNTLKIENLTLF